MRRHSAEGHDGDIEKDHEGHDQPEHPPAEPAGQLPRSSESGPRRQVLQDQRGKCQDQADAGDDPGKEEAKESDQDRQSEQNGADNESAQQRGRPRKRLSRPERAAEVALRHDEDGGGGADGAEHGEQDQVDEREAQVGEGPARRLDVHIDQDRDPGADQGYRRQRGEMPPVELEGNVDDLARGQRAQGQRVHRPAKMCPGPDDASPHDAGVLSQHARTGLPSASRSRDPRARDARSRDRGDRVPGAGRHPGHADPRRMPFAAFVVLSILAGYGFTSARWGCCHAPAGRLRRVDRLLHLLRGAAPGADAGQADRGDPGADGYRPRGHPRPPRPCGICFAWPISFRRPTSSAPSSSPFIPAPSVWAICSPARSSCGIGRAMPCSSGAWPWPPDAAPGAARAGGRRVPVAGAVSAAPGRAPGRGADAAREHAGGSAGRRRHPEASPTHATCWCSTTPERAGEGGASVAPIAVRGAEARAMGRVPAAGGSRLAPGAGQLRVGGAARLCGALSRGRRGSGAGANLPGGRGDARPARATGGGRSQCAVSRRAEHMAESGDHGAGCEFPAAIVRAAPLRPDRRSGVPAPRGRRVRGHPRPPRPRRRGPARRHPAPGRGGRGAPGGGADAMWTWRRRTAR